MFGLSRLIAFAIVFCMGFGLAAGLFVATALTLLVLPTMYAALYRVEVE